MKRILLAGAAVAALVGPAFAEDAKDEKKWDVAAPPGVETRKVQINVDEGTWMNVDVSPDGRTIAFDLLGDIYTMPIAGGAPTRIAEGLPFEMQPRFSPDGKKIAFTSDRGGGDNLWIMNRDGSDKRQVTKETFRLVTAPDWSADGHYLIGRKHFTTGRSLGTGEIWMYHLGGGDGVKLIKRPNETYQKELGEPVFAPDGASLYYAHNTTPGDTFIYAQDGNGEIFAIERFDIATGETTRIAGGAGGAVRPAPSPDGKYLAFVKREREKSKLYLMDLATGAERKIYDALDLDMQETWAVHGAYPVMDWTPDSKSVVFWAGGKIRRVTTDGAASEIPFRISDDRVVIDPPRPAIEVAPETVRTTMPRFATVSPDGRTVVFETLGKLWVKSLPNGTPKRLTGSAAGRELFPSFSADGKRLVYVSWTDDGLGEIRLTSAGGGAGSVVTKTPGVYRRPRLSPDNKTVVFEKGTSGYLLSDKYAQAPGVYRINASGGEMTKVSDDGSNPHFGKDNDRIFMQVRDGNETKLVSVGMNGEDKRVHASGDLLTDYQVSPDGKRVAFRDNWAAYVMPMTPGPQEIGAGKSASALPVVKASEGGSAYLSWSGPGEIRWTLGPTLYSARVAEMIPTAPKKDGEEAKKFTPPTTGANLSISAPADHPSGVTVIRNARIITMKGDDGGVIENGHIVIRDNRIVAVGEGEAAYPAGARIVDAAGKTITPGFIDAHAHGAQGEDDIIPEQNWSAIAHLALGVTTIHDPSNNASEVFPAASLQRTGKLLAPRIFSTGDVVYGAKAPGFFSEIESYDDALAHVRRLKAQGAHSIKNYNQPRRDQRQQVAAAGKAENMTVVAEGASLFTQDMTLIADGNSALEHNIPQANLYEDVLSFFSQTKAAYTPTLVVTYGGLAGDPYWRYATDVWLHPILSKHVPPHILQPNNVRRTKAPEEDFVDQMNAREAKKLADRGVMVSIGAHGQEEGLGSHWEMWSFVRGGMSPLEALKAATATPATALGYIKDIGTIEKGKLADLVILNANPLDDIGNTDEIDKVMLNGRLYDAATMNEVVTGSAKRAPYYWE
ncbi:MAG: amidohydrolase [Alphaproteobacteria bacterium RIFCSPHIGHO2_12_FULL_63_12]|nr:MAG: amidohydrolase [Alphaproteobacteria bacterium RIFCSPHIGHO2_12_FULL_63_12]